MTWNEAYSKMDMPQMADITKFIDCEFWEKLCQFIEAEYGVKPLIEHSTCTGAPGWNVKYRKGGKALCTLYPNNNYFTCLIAIGEKIAMEAECVVATVLYLNELYINTKPLNGSRWLSIEVKSEEVFEAVKKLVLLRVAPKKKSQ